MAETCIARFEDSCLCCVAVSRLLTGAPYTGSIWGALMALLQASVSSNKISGFIWGHAGRLRYA
jgi:hypothetical protein